MRCAPLLLILLSATCFAAPSVQTEAEKQGRRTQAQDQKAATPTKHKSAAEVAASLNARMGPCKCTIDPYSREADDRTIGTVEVRDLHDDKFKLSVVNESHALDIFQKMTFQGKIPFGFPEDGCFARAHEMSYQLAKKKIETGKVFATGVFRINNEKAENGHVTWGFHVAPVIAVARGDHRTLWVIDPSMFYEPVSIETWLAKLTEQPGSHINTAYLTTKYVYHPAHRDKKLKAFDTKDLAAARKMMKRYLKAEIKREHAPGEEDGEDP